MSGGELIPIVTTAGKDAAKPLSEAIGTTLSDVWQAVVGDRVAAWRLKNAAAYHEPLKRELAEHGVMLNLDKIPERFAFTWFDKATQSDEPEIQELFAKLLANAARGNEDALRKRNIELVSGLTPSDAKLLEIINKRFRDYAKRVWAGHRHMFTMTMDSKFYQGLIDDGLEDVSSVDALVAVGVLRFLTYTSVDQGAIAALFELPREINRNDLVINPSAMERMLTTTQALNLTRVGVSLLDALYPASSASADAS